MDHMAAVQQYLREQGCSCELVSHDHRVSSALQAARKAAVSPFQLAKAIVLEDEQGLLMAVVPAAHCIDLKRLNACLHRDMARAKLPDRGDPFHGCAPDALPPLPDLYGVDCVVDSAVTDPDIVYFEPGTHDTLVGVSSADFCVLLGNARHGLTFSYPVFGLDACASGEPRTLEPRAALKRRLEQLEALPPVPEVAASLLALKGNPRAEVRDLARVIELDPALSSQIVRYARSPFFAYQGKITSVHDAIARVLGYTTAMNIALGIATGKTFAGPFGGPVGVRAVWRRAVYTATLSQELARAMPAAKRPQPGGIYLAGLLHNLGYLLLGHLFPRELGLLNHAVVRQPERPMAELGLEVLGIHQGEIAAWLMQAWRMPEEIIVTQREHHNTAYRGRHATYVRLVQLATHLLEGWNEIPPALPQSLGLTDEQAWAAWSRIQDNAPQLDAMAQQLAA